MTEKVKVTQEEFNCLEGYSKTQESIDYMINTHTLQLRPDLPIAKWSTAKLSRALLTGYEVKPRKFEGGDWIFNEAQQKIFRIDSADAVGINNSPERYEHLRHVTMEEKKERDFWANSGRKVWQLKEGDTLVKKGDVHTCDVKFVEVHDEYGTVLANGFQDEYFESVEELKSKYKVFCFVEDRKDKK